MLASSRVQLTTIAFASCILLYWFFHESIANTSECLITSSAYDQSASSSYSYVNLNTERSNTSLSPVLILTPFKQSVQFIDRYFDNINRLTYPHKLISLGFLVSDSSDGTIEKLQARSQAETERFNSIRIFQKDFQYDLATTEERHAFEVQVQRRSIMAKSRNTLLSAALTQDHEWVLWLDGDVVDYPETLLEELIGMNKDVLAPNCFWQSYNEEGGYDKNNWQETPESRSFLETLPEDQVLVEGYPELVTHRKLMIDMRFEGETDLFHAVPLDAVGGTCTLVRAKVHRDGAIFPPFVYQHQVETEGLAKMAKSLGYEVWGLPNYLVYHYI
ncbi:MAG: Anp1-domain-containing protein [Benjaminiella poitrasii]|nr:MAG: Anp1-domain-containing protein [Benjaminiella poitrasii]